MIVSSIDYNKIIKIWDLQTGHLLHSINIKGPSSHYKSFKCLAISPDGKTVFSGNTDKTIKEWNLQTGQLLHTLTGHSHKVLSVAISPDGNTIVSGGREFTIKIWGLP